jgi:AcrR family transcriptional regulator
MDLRERTRQAVRADIAAVAMRLFVARGFDATTMEEIAAAAGISRRSLFRYFATKEDVALGDQAERGRVVQAVLESRPAGEGPWEALRAALEALADRPDYSVESVVEISRMFHNTPSLRARRLEKQLQWMELLVPDIERRLGVRPGDGPDPRAPALVASALACLDAALDAWGRRGGEGRIEDLYDQAVAAVRA